MEWNAPVIMGVVNVTPDSFSDGGQFFDVDAAVGRSLEMMDQGAHIIDLGGESTRPGSAPVEEEEEKRRLLPVIKEILRRRPRAYLSVDTVKGSVAREALRAGARMINDISTLRQDGVSLAAAVAEGGADLVIMHSRKKPADMQEEITYQDLLGEVIAELRQAVELAQDQGVAPDRIWIDPGIGFAKTAAQCMELLARTADLGVLGKKILVGPSRKSFIAAVDPSDPSHRLGGTAAAVTAAIFGGATGIRVHDVPMMRQTALVAHRIAQQHADARDAGGGEG